MADHSDIAERSFERLADAKGDITAEVIARYYENYPDAKASFEHHGLDNVPELEGRMVTETAFLLMQWAAAPAATKLEQGTTICNHQDTLEVGPHWYIGLIDAVLEVLFETIPEHASDERTMWRNIRSELTELIETVRPEFWRKENEGPLPPSPI